MSIKGILLLAYGSPETLADVEAYYTHIRRGNPPTADQLEELLGRYRAIGGGSPLCQITARQALALERRLAQSGSADQYRVYVGYKHVLPSITDAVEAMAKDQVLQAVGIVLAPHYSRMSVGVYFSEAKDRAAELGINLQQVDHWYKQYALNQALRERLREALAKLEGVQRIKVIFSAHSLPERIVATGDPYPQQLLDHCELLAKGMNIDWQFAWQSAGRTSEPWLGPDILKVIGELPEQGIDAVVSCPLGFVADHLEVLYDLDIEVKQLAHRLGMKFVRTRSLNDDPTLVEALFQAVVYA